MAQLITGELFKKMLINAAAAIENNKQEINDLNVFPIPDGDTGTNMRLTIGAAENALADMTPGTLGHVADVTAGAMLRGARGNSGVILSLLFRGFAKRLKDIDAADSSTFAFALASGVDSAYKAVMNPAEGTILTVSRLTADSAVTVAKDEDDIGIVLEKAIETGYIALSETTDQNPVLKKAGVVDAGAKGYLYILEGMLKALHGIFIEKAVNNYVVEKADFSKFTDEDINYTYCTEFIIERSGASDTNRLRDFLDRRGDSVVVVDDDEIIKVHVHSNEPGTILTEALRHGTLHALKIDNMRDQHSETIAEGASSDTDAPEDPAIPEEMKEYGIVVVCAGHGIEEVFRDLGADHMIAGGQTMNPSTEDILEKIEITPANTVYVLPNNKNIIMTAQQCISLSTKRVVVIPTRSIPQGIAAMLAMEEASGEDDMAVSMSAAANRVHTVDVTLAARDSVFDGSEIKEGEYLALLEDSLLMCSSDIHAVVNQVATKLEAFRPEFITIFAGEDVDEDKASSVESMISAASPNAEITVVMGGQPIYQFIISAE